MHPFTVRRAPPGSPERRAALRMASRQWPSDPPSGRELDVAVAVCAGTGAVVGTVALDAVSDLPDRPELGPWMVNLVVVPGRRGAGVGTRLLRWAAERWAPAWFWCPHGLLEWYLRRVPAALVAERRPQAAVCFIPRGAGCGARTRVKLSRC